MKKILRTIAVLTAITAGLISEATALESCGSSWKQLLAIPEYYCYGLEGGAIPYAACAAGTLVGYKAVYFGAACQKHDRCYESKGASRSTCDLEFKDLLISTCDQRLDGKFRKISRKTCRAQANYAYRQVRTSGCKPFIAAQKKSGAATSQSCD